MASLSILRGNNGKPNQCASAASRRAQANAITGGEVGSSDFSDRVIERFGDIPASKPTDPSNIGSFTAQDGAGTKGEMGKGSERIAANSTNEDDELDPGETHHVSGSPQEDRSGTACTVGEVEGGKESGLDGRAGPMEMPKVSLKDIKTDPLAHEPATSEGTRPYLDRGTP
jgi:hypothetical protein